MLTDKQLAVLARPINSTRVASRKQGGKTLSYVEAWDVKAHLIRVFGYGGFDTELIDYHHVGNREYTANEKDMVEVIYAARVRLVIRDPEGNKVATYMEGAVGSTSGPATMLGEHHDNALKTAESDALKRCAINLGNQFGLSLYDDGSKLDIIRGTVLDPPKDPKAPPPAPPVEVATTVEEAKAALEHSLGATEVKEPA